MTSEIKPPEFKSIGDAPQSIYTGVPGWITEREQGVLLALAQGLHIYNEDDIHSIVEIGSENGQSASIFAKYNGSAHIVCIEINEDAPFQWNLETIDLLVSAIYTDSTQAHWPDIAQKLNHKDDNIDLLFIDGDHSRKAVSADLENFAGYIKVGGLLLLHDCDCETNKIPHAQHKDVSFALNKWLIDGGYALGFKHLFSVDSLMVFRRF